LQRFAIILRNDYKKVMSRIFLLIVFLFFLFNLIDPACGQEPDAAGKKSGHQHILNRFSVGLHSGINFASLQGKLKQGKWESNSGAINGLYFEYALSDHFDLHTGLIHESLYLTHKDYSYSNGRDEPGPGPWHLFNPDVLYPSSYNSNRHWNFNMYRIPLQIQFHTQTRLRFELAAGTSFGFLVQAVAPHNSCPIYYNEQNIIRANEDASFPEHDWGYYYSAGIDYPVDKQWTIGVAGNYYSGSREFLEHTASRLESLAFMLNVEYSGIHDDGIKTYHSRDSLKSKWFITYKTGMLLSNHRGNQFQNSYSPRIGLSGGIAFYYHLDESFSLQAELLYQRKGYHLEDSSRYPYRMATSPDIPVQFDNDTRVDLDYFTLPVLLNVRFGQNEVFFMNGGFYYSFNFNARATGTQYETHITSNTYQRKKLRIYDHMEGYIKDGDWGWVLGAGLRLPVWGSADLELELRYDQSFTDNYQNLGDREYMREDRAFFNEGLQLMVGIHVPIY